MSISKLTGSPASSPHSAPKTPPLFPVTFITGSPEARSTTAADPPSGREPAPAGDPPSGREPAADADAPPSTEPAVVTATRAVRAKRRTLWRDRTWILNSVTPLLPALLSAPARPPCVPGTPARIPPASEPTATNG
ncbi:hypothetical protein GCM10009789_04790 [Kribbella sancticallisti]|uniref:Uncharacterized protein n=1 Tax=Kribbella sancticallisti TaxID=460087 RepID=A0ABP4N2R2_9ACTN